MMAVNLRHSLRTAVAEQADSESRRVPAIRRRLAADAHALEPAVQLDVADLDAARAAADIDHRLVGYCEVGPVEPSRVGKRLAAMRIEAAIAKPRCSTQPCAVP